MRNLFTLLLVLSLFSARANNYYFSAVSGDDSRTPVQAQNPSTPWKSISKLNSYFSSFQPGDSILLKCSETFYGSITVNKSGTANLPIVISSYGTGIKPLITSLVTLNNWVSVGNGIWESYNSNLDKKLNIVLLDGIEQQLGRYPNSDAPNKGYLTLESHISNTITDSELTSAPNWTGAELVLRSRRWVLDRDTVTSHSGNTITFAASSGYSAINGYGYFIQNDIKTLDQQGEWYYNSSAKKLSVYFGSNAPSAYTVQATTIDNLISSQKYSNVVFDNLSIKGANSSGIYVKYGSNMRISNCDIMFSGENGISAYFHANLKIENCTISYSNNGGIDLGYVGDNATIRNNKILNTSVFAGMGGSGDGKGLAIHSNGSGSIIEYNEIRNTGYIALSFNGDSVTVKNNFIDSFCITKDDGSGIYTWLGSSAPRKGRKVIGNIVLNGIGVSEGTDVRYSAAEGIYMDNNTSYVDISGNTVANCTNNGLFLHSANTLTIKNNTFYNNFKQLLASQDADKGNGPIRNCIITNNNFFSKRPEQTIVNQRSYADDISLFARFDSNYYNRPFADWFIISNSYNSNSGTRVNQSFDLQEWKASSGNDLASTKAAKQIIPYKLNSLTSSNKFVNGTFSTTMRGIYSSSCTASLSNSGLLDGGYLQVVPSAQSASVFVNVGELKAGAKYILRYSVKGSDSSAMYVGASLRKAASPYTVLTAIQYRKVNLSRSENEILFTSSTNETSAQIVFKTDSVSKYYLDNIQLYEADASITNIDDSVRFVYNATQLSKTVSLNGSYADVKNNKYSNSIVLLPYQSAVLIKDNSILNIAPTVAITSPAVNTAIAAPASVTINATAADTDGTISKVDFYNNNTLIGTAAVSPYTFTWNNVPAGNYSITAKATDNDSLATASAAVSISVYTPNAAPSVNITSPAVNTAIAAPASVTISATAADTDGTISKVDFYNNDTLIGTAAASPYTFTWNNIPAGNYSITAKATDDSSAVTASAAVSISVYTPNVAPSVGITSPVTNATLAAPASVTIGAIAADTDGKINKVDFYSNDTLIGSAAASPYTFTWNNVSAGTYSITAKATDDSSAVTTSAAILISVYTSNIAPSVSIISPAATTKYTGPATINITAAASDADGTISSVKFYNGTTYLKTVFTSPYTYSMTNIAAGTYTITAKATDNKGLATISAPVTLTVLQNVAPSVSIISPVATAKYIGPATVNISAAASDADGTISSVKFYNGTTYLKTVYASPYTCSMSNLAAGSYTITAKATDNKGLVTISAPVVITVLQNAAPLVNITSPVINATYNAPATINLSASASDKDGSISKVDFYNGTTLLISKTVAPYSYSWQNVPSGNYTIIAKATDNKGAVTSSQSVTISLVAPTATLKMFKNNDTSGPIGNTHAVNLKRADISKAMPVIYTAKVFPNPAVNRIQISVDGLKMNNQKAALSIQNLSGITVKSIPVILSGKTLEADVTSLTSGMYIISIVSDDFIISKKFIKN